MDDRQTWALLRQYTMVAHHRYLGSLRLAREVAKVLGDVVECGVFRGGMIAGIARTLGNDRRYWLFDSFEGLPAAQLEVDGRKATTLTGRCRAGEHHAIRAMHLAGITNYQLVKGWFEDTLPTQEQAAEMFPQGIALLRLDADWYTSTTQALEALMPSVVKGGIVIVDDYYVWDGCARALHDYLSRHGRTERIEQDGPWQRPGQPVCFLRARGWRGT